MADLGKLDDYQDYYDLTLQFGRRKFKLKPSVEQVLDFKHAGDELQKGAVPTGPAPTVTRSAWEPRALKRSKCLFRGPGYTPTRQRLKRKN